MIAGALLLFSFNVDVIMGIPPGFVEGDYLFGKTVGVVDEKMLILISIMTAY